jgi:hypothetical protein
MNIVVMVSVVAVVGVTLLALGIYLIDKNANHRDQVGQ